MACNVNDNTINPPSPPAGFGLGNLAPSSPDIPSINPKFPMEDLASIFNLMSFTLPSGVIKPGLSESYSKNVLDGALSLLQVFMPFLYTYAFFLPILDMVLCIIEVLCSIPNPFKMRRAIRRLFRTCIPNFLSLFPSTALIPMILSLLTLIIVMLQYLLDEATRIFNTIKDNIKILSKAISRNDSDSILAVTTKIGQLLCMLQNLFVIINLVGVILSVITSIKNLVFKVPPCDSSGSSDDDCCTPDVCPDFIRNNETITTSNGSFKYLNEASINSGSVLPSFFPPIKSIVRKESWQFYDASLSQKLAFINITSPYDLPPETTKVFFPQGVSYDQNTPTNRVPYTIDLRLLYNPLSFGRDFTIDPAGTRFIKITSAIITQAPYAGVYDWQNILQMPTNGTLVLAGGKVYEDDGITPLFINGVQGTLETLVHINPNTSSGGSPTLSSSDGYEFNNVEYTFHINHDILLENSMITLGCVPDVAFDTNFINATISSTVKANASILAAMNLPDTNSLISCMSNSISKFRSNISEETISIVESDVNSCISSFANDLNSSILDLILTGFDPYNSTFTLSPELQFTTGKILLSVYLKDNKGNLIANNLQAQVSSALALKFKATPSFGSLENFSYDGSSAFTTEISSDMAGSGNITVDFNGKTLSILNNSTNINTSPSVSSNVLGYEFIDAKFGDSDGKERRTNTDISDMVE